jgi:hypothetical protein
MGTNERIAAGLSGTYRDVLRDAAGRVVWESGWRRNTIVVDCRRLLAGFLRGSPTVAMGITGVQFGAGVPAWDQTPPPAPTENQTALADGSPFTLPRAQLQVDFLDPAGTAVSATPTRKLQVVAKLGPGVPAWPDAQHPTTALREFGLVASLENQTVLLNYVIHPVITKDPTSSLERTIWLVF